jgi:DNA topoisomerase-1
MKTSYRYTSDLVRYTSEQRGTSPASRPSGVATEAAQTPPEAAASAGLHYTSDTRPGIRRKRAGKGFSYTDADGHRINDRTSLQRIRRLAIPPAWTDVWISPDPLGHVQATGRDVRGRKQYRYHERWREVRDENKYGRMLDFAKVLPRIRARTSEDLAKPGLPREKVLAAVVRLLEKTLIRVGNEEYARENNSFGLTTMRGRHVKVSGSRIGFRFRGKSRIEHEVHIVDRRLARVIVRCGDLPGQDLFQYIDEDGEPHPIDSDDVNAYIREISDVDFTAKDFRTWAGTVLAARALQEVAAFDSEAQAKKNVVQAIETVAKRLGNTRAICRKCYVHPAIIDAYLDGEMVKTVRERVDEELRDLDDLSGEEAAVLALLRKRLAEEAA